MIPNAPINLSNLPEITDSSKIGFQWEDDKTGGATINSYQIWYALSTDEEFTKLEDEYTTKSYTTMIDLVAGKQYKFKVTARNIIGTSDYSAPMTIRAGAKPSKPTKVTTTENIDPNGLTDGVSISWEEPSDGGIPI